MKWQPEPIDSIVKSRIILLKSGDDCFRISWRRLKRPVYEPGIDEVAAGFRLPGKRPDDFRRRRRPLVGAIVESFRGQL